MNKAKSGGFKLTEEDCPIVMGMLDREDRKHDIAAWFGVNPARIDETRKRGGKIAPPEKLPPKGAPGVKGRNLRDSLGSVVELLKKATCPEAIEALSLLEKALEKYNNHEA